MEFYLCISQFSLSPSPLCSPSVGLTVSALRSFSLTNLSHLPLKAFILFVFLSPASSLSFSFPLSHSKHSMSGSVYVIERDV